jgi:hypothetical protein
MVKCKFCKKEFVSDNPRYKYCSTKCYKESMDLQNKMKKIKNHIRKEIHDIRVHWDFLRVHYPEKAKEILKQMNKEENPDFIELMLDGFKELN